MTDNNAANNGGAEAPPPGPVQNPERGVGKNGNAADGNQQQPLLNWRRLGVDRWVDLLFTAALTGATILNSCTSVRLSTIANGQLAIMQADHRAWISAFPINLVGSLTHNDSGLSFTMQFTLKNTGRSPSRATFVSFTPSFSGQGPQVTKKVCSDAENSMLRLTIFPGDIVVQGVGGMIPEIAFARFRDDMKNGNFSRIDTILPSITACIAYRDMESDTFHHTSYAFYISKSGSDASPLRMMLDQQTISASDFMLACRSDFSPTEQHNERV
jgi:hypothetical protein